ncbi:MAG: type I restriction enzyme HsdR N-terminal domain-containing protein [Bacteroidetes bacterium]|jgi:hypothetical protein|nr:type I restriction enzyme HsdR N-terminal domain-containing protein [Bacteroidota bacterium]
MLPAYPYPATADGLLWDPIRRCYAEAKPEEWVRQRLLFALLSQVQVPPARIAVERRVLYMGRPRRFDVLVFDTAGRASLLCECKAPGVPLSATVALQAASYNRELQAPLVLLTNGDQCLLLDAQMARPEEEWSIICQILHQKIQPQAGPKSTP